MPNWERTPPVAGMSVEEIKKRVAAGLKKRRETGELRPEGLREITLEADPTSGHFDKRQRKLIIQASNLAIYSLANNEREDYCGAVSVINNVRQEAGFPSSLMQALCNGIASAAAEASGEPFDVLDQLARRWLQVYYEPSGKVISIPKRRTPSDGK